MGKIADNAEQQKHNNAAPQQKIFPFAALGEPLWIPQHPNQKCRQPQRREQSNRQIFPGGTEEIQMQQANAKMRDAAARTCQTGDLLEQAGDPQRCQLGDDIIRQPQQKKMPAVRSCLRWVRKKKRRFCSKRDTSLPVAGKFVVQKKAAPESFRAAFVFCSAGKAQALMPAGSVRSASGHRTRYPARKLPESDRECRCCRRTVRGTLSPDQWHRPACRASTTCRRCR